MGVMDRIRRMEATGELDQSRDTLPGEKLPVPAENIVVVRTRIAFAAMMQHLRDNGSEQQRRYSWLIEAFIDEALEDMSTASTEGMAELFEQISMVLEWISTGKVKGQVPESFLGIELKAIESGEPAATSS